MPSVISLVIHTEILLTLLTNQTTNLKKYQLAETSNRYKNCIKWQGIPHQHMMCQAHSLNPLLPSATNMRRSAKILILI